MFGFSDELKQQSTCKVIVEISHQTLAKNLLVFRGIINIFMHKIGLEFKLVIQIRQAFSNFLCLFYVKCGIREKRGKTLQHFLCLLS